MFISCDSLILVGTVDCHGHAGGRSIGLFACHSICSSVRTLFNIFLVKNVSINLEAPPKVFLDPQSGPPGCTG